MGKVCGLNARERVEADLLFHGALGKLIFYGNIRFNLYWSGPHGPGVRDRGHARRFEAGCD